MSTFSRSLFATAAGLALFGLSACGGTSTGGGPSVQPPAPGAALQSFDPCTFFTPEELTSFGVGTTSQDFTQVSFQPGCEWEGEKLSIGLQKNAKDTVQSLGHGGGFDKFEPTNIAGREAAEIIVGGATDQGVCNYAVSAGGGFVMYQLSGFMRDSVPDPCGELEKVVNQTASRLPQ
ncbi:DUF3558 domain-containing protein [Saccharopolyspora aridisoli]|uniref:DUF3558 domain-containing protein n=1 Tax=Saccharopolyspora aridisoli TaxID=2530385 RepID=A0A4R4UMQ7_9PSEU|nr:DUF3558 domain-containing protein [Saccharopolyspora aridisoli]TDC90414.1 DUF3558 domain-containing protein [Saccharopolyspora aridisoli]